MAYSCRAIGNNSQVMRSKIFFDHVNTPEIREQIRRAKPARLALVTTPPAEELSTVTEASHAVSTRESLSERTIPKRPDSVSVDHDNAFRKCSLDFDRLASRRIFVGADDERYAVKGHAVYKALRTSVLRQLDLHQLNSLMVVGPTQNVGKTLTAINIALAMARNQEKRVLLVDLDLRSPSIHKELGFESSGDIVDVAEGRKKLREVLVDPGIDRLTVLPAIRRWEDSAERLMTSNMHTVFDRLRAIKQCIVVYDTPPILGCDDVAAIHEKLGACLMVVRQNVTTKRELERSLGSLGSATRLLGVTINRSNEMNFENYYY